MTHKNQMAIDDFLDSVKLVFIENKVNHQRHIAVYENRTENFNVIDEDGIMTYNKNEFDECYKFIDKFDLEDTLIEQIVNFKK